MSCTLTPYAANMERPAVRSRAKGISQIVAGRGKSSHVPRAIVCGCYPGRHRPSQPSRCPGAQPACAPTTQGCQVMSTTVTTASQRNVQSAAAMTRASRVRSCPGITEARRSGGAADRPPPTLRRAAAAARPGEDERCPRDPIEANQGGRHDAQCFDLVRRKRVRSEISRAGRVHRAHGDARRIAVPAERVSRVGIGSVPHVTHVRAQIVSGGDDDVALPAQAKMIGRKDRRVIAGGPMQQHRAQGTVR
jgi:hypothetical protein